MIINEVNLYETFINKKLFLIFFLVLKIKIKLRKTKLVKKISKI